MLIGEVSRLTGATCKAIRYYEKIGLITEPQRKGNYRVYTEQDIIVISMIKRAQEFGFSLAELKNLIKKKSKDNEFPLKEANELIEIKLQQIVDKQNQLKVLKSNLIKLKRDLFDNFS